MWIRDLSTSAVFFFRLLQSLPSLISQIVSFFNFSNYLVTFCFLFWYNLVRLHVRKSTTKVSLLLSLSFIIVFMFILVNTNWTICSSVCRVRSGHWQAVSSDGVYAFWCVVAFDFGGVVTNSRREPDTTNRNKRPGSLKEMHWLVARHLANTYWSTEMH